MEEKRRPRILVTEPIDPAGIAGFEEYADVTLGFDADRERLLKLVADHDALVVRTKYQIDREFIDHGPRLKVIAMNGIGLNHIDVDYAKEKGIAVLNVPDASNDSVAELTIGLMLGLARRITPAFASVRNGEWIKGPFVGTELKDKTLGIIALGKIGSRVAHIAQAIGMKVIAFDPFVTPEAAARMNVTLVSLDGLIEQADVISIHAPLTKDTYHLLGAEQLAKMKKGSFIVNAGRGGIVDEDAVYEALTSGHLGGFACDVMETEPPGKNRLFDLPNVLVTPHIGGSTQEAQRRIGLRLAAQIKEIIA
ncbi:MAG: hydroxyacid dehydrogenase [bacterium]